MEGISVLGISSLDIHGLQERTLVRTSLAKKLLKHENPLEHGKIVHQISECL